MPIQVSGAGRGRCMGGQGAVDLKGQFQSVEQSMRKRLGRSRYSDQS